jgi:hypothetical protein
MAALVPALALLPQLPLVVSAVIDGVHMVERLFHGSKGAGLSKKQAAMNIVGDVLKVYTAAETGLPKLPQVDAAQAQSVISRLVDDIVAVNNLFGVFTHSTPPAK